jgi:hypothetical protein
LPIENKNKNVKQGCTYVKRIKVKFDELAKIYLDKKLF